LLNVNIISLINKAYLILLVIRLQDLGSMIFNEAMRMSQHVYIN